MMPCNPCMKTVTLQDGELPGHEMGSMRTTRSTLQGHDWEAEVDHLQAAA